MPSNLVSAQTLTIGNISAWRPDGQFVAISDGMVIQILDSTGSQVIHTLANFTDNIQDIAWSSDGTKLAVATGNEIEIWLQPEGPASQLLMTYQHEFRVRDVEWHPDQGSTIISSVGFGPAIHIWDTMTGNVQYVLESDALPITAAHWSPDGSKIASVGQDGSSNIYDVNTGAIVGGITLMNRPSVPIKGLVWNAAGDQVITISENTLFLWGFAATGAGLLRGTGYIDTDFAEKGIAFNPTSDLVATINQNGNIEVWWSINDHLEFLERIEAGFIPDLHWHPNGQQLTYVNANGNAIEMIDVSITTSIGSFTLINADTEEDIRPLVDMDVVDLDAIGTENFNIRANVDPATVGSVVFDLDGTLAYSVQNAPHYTLAGYSNGDYAAWAFSEGEHTLTATSYIEPDGMGDGSTPLTITFTVIR